MATVQAEESELEEPGDDELAGRRLGLWSWALFDWANQPYFTLITTFIFAPYFAATVVGDATRGQSLWGYAQSVAGLAIALLSPVLGAMADAAGPRKPWTFVFQAFCVVGSIGLWWAVPGADADRILLVLVLVTIASIGAEFSIVFNNAMLPSLVGERWLGRLSGYAWGLGYLGGLISLAGMLTAFSLAETPLFGLDKAAYENVRIVGPLTAGWLVIFVIPLFVFTPDAPRTGLGRLHAARRGLAQLWTTLRALGHYRNVALFFIARMTYQDGLSAIFAFGGIYAAGIFGWSTVDLGIFGIIITLFAAVGAAAGGWLDDRIGSKRTLLIAVTGLFVATLGVVSITAEPAGTGLRHETLLFLFDATVPAGAGMFATPGQLAFLGFGILIGICGGPAQAASRTMVSRLVPTRLAGEFYGLFALSGKATAFIAPFLIALVTTLYGSQRAGVSVILGFLGLGLVLLLPVREQRTEAPD